MTTHRIYFPTAGARPGAEVVISGEEARHAARVKRIEPGEGVELFDGRGRVIVATVSDIRKEPRAHDWQVVLRATEVKEVPRPVPRLEVCTAVPKGPRLEEMIDQLSQVGVAAWAPLAAERSVVEPRDGKISRLNRVAAESAKQCGRAWILEIGEGCTFAAAMGTPGAIVADISGPRYEPDTGNAAGPHRLIIGPEGGWTRAELDGAARAEARVHSFGMHVMRVETAAVVAAGIVLEALRHAAR